MIKRTRKQSWLGKSWRSWEHSGSKAIRRWWELPTKMSRSPVWVFVTPCTVTHQAPQSMGFSRQENWSGLPFFSTGDLPDPGIESGSPALKAGSSSSEPPGKFHSDVLLAAAATKSLQSCPTLCDPMDSNLPGSVVHGIFQARKLEWAAISFFRGSSQPRDWTRVSRTAGRHFTVWATREAQGMLGRM